MAGEEQGHEAEVPEGGGDNNDPDRPFEAPGGEIPTPGIDEADWGNLADAVSAHGEIPDDLDEGVGDGEPEGDGLAELMSAWEEAQSAVTGEVGSGPTTPEVPAANTVIDMTPTDDGGDAELISLDELPPDASTEE